jgi:hypothetical protein
MDGCSASVQTEFARMASANNKTAEQQTVNHSAQASLRTQSMNANFTRRSTLMCILVSCMTASAAFAQGTTTPPSTGTDPVAGHPRVNEVNQRLANQQNRIQNGEADGKISATRAAKEEQHDANVAQRESADEAKNGGHLTKGEQAHLNQSLNKNSARIKDNQQQPPQQ